METNKRILLIAAVFLLAAAGTVFATVQIKDVAPANGEKLMSPIQVGFTPVDSSARGAFNCKIYVDGKSLLGTRPSIPVVTGVHRVLPASDIPPELFYSPNEHELYISCEKDGSIAESRSKFTIVPAKIKISSVKPDDGELRSASGVALQYKASVKPNTLGLECKVLLNGNVVAKDRIKGTEAVVLKSHPFTPTGGMYAMEIACTASDRTVEVERRNFFFPDFPRIVPKIKISNVLPKDKAKLASQIVKVQYVPKATPAQNMRCTVSFDGSATPAGIVENAPSGQVQVFSRAIEKKGDHTVNITCAARGASASEIRKFTVPDVPLLGLSGNTVITFSSLSPADEAVFSKHNVTIRYKATAKPAQNMACTIHEGLSVIDAANISSGTARSAWALFDEDYHYWQVACVAADGTVAQSVEREFEVSENPLTSDIRHALPWSDLLFGDVSSKPNVSLQATVDCDECSGSSDKAVSCDIYVNNVKKHSIAGVVPYDEEFEEYGTFRYEYAASYADGKYYPAIFCRGPGSLESYVQGRPFYVRDETVYATAVSPANGAVFGSGNVSFAYSASVPTGASMFCDLYVDGSVSDMRLVASGQATIVNRELPVGQHSWHVNCTPIESTESGIGGPNSFIIDPAAIPAITLSSPEAGATFYRGYASSLKYSVSASRTPVSCGLYVDGELVKSSTLAEPGTSSFEYASAFQTGNRSWKAKCTGIAGQTESEERNFSVVPPPPILAMLASPANNAENSEPSLAHTYIIATTIPGAQCRAYVNGTAKYASAGNGTFSFVGYYPEGAYSWQVRCNTTYSGDTAATETWAFRQVPRPQQLVVAALSPANGSVLNNSNVTFMYHVLGTDGGQADCKLYLNGEEADRRTAYGTTFVEKTLQNGNYIWSASCASGNISGASTSQAFELAAPASNASGAAALPDLAISSLKLNGTVYVNKRAHGSVETKNIGNGTAGNSTTSYYINGARVNLVAMPQLAPGASSTGAITFICTRAGTYTLSARADAGNSVIESNEKNNERAISFTCFASKITKVSGPEGTVAASLAVENAAAGGKRGHVDLSALAVVLLAIASIGYFIVDAVAEKKEK